MGVFVTDRSQKQLLFQSDHRPNARKQAQDRACRTKGAGIGDRQVPGIGDQQIPEESVGSSGCGFPVLSPTETEIRGGLIRSVAEV